MAKTPADRWKDTVSRYRRRCQKIMALSPGIRYAGAINAYGRTLAGMVRPGLRPLLKSEQVKNEFFVVSTLMSLRKSTSATAGSLSHVILEHQKVTILILAKKDITYYVSINKGQRNLDGIISKIKGII